MENISITNLEGVVVDSIPMKLSAQKHSMKLHKESLLYLIALSREWGGLMPELDEHIGEVESWLSFHEFMYKLGVKYAKPAK